MGIHSVTLNLIISQNTPLGSRRRVFAGLHAMYGIASFLCPLLISKVVGFYLSWQEYFLLLSIILLIIFFLSFSMKEKKSFNLRNAAESIKLRKPLWPMAILFSCYVSAEVLLSSRLVYYLTESKGFSSADASFQLSLFFIYLLIGRVSFALIPVKINTLTLLKISAPSSFILCLLGILYSPQFLAICGLSMSYFFPCAMDYIGEYFSAKELEIAFAKVMVCVGGVLVVLHLSFGQLTSWLSLDVSIWLLPSLIFFVLYILHIYIPFLAKGNDLVKSIE